jgi:hypothetical protein
MKREDFQTQDTMCPRKNSEKISFGKAGAVAARFVHHFPALSMGDPG